MRSTESSFTRSVTWSNMFNAAGLFAYVLVGGVLLVLAIAAVGGGGPALINGIAIVISLYFGLRFFNRLERRDRRDRQRKYHHRGRR